MWSYPDLSVSAPLLDQAPSGQIGVLWSVLMNPCDGCHRLCRGPAGQPDRSAELAIRLVSDLGCGQHVPDNHLSSFSLYVVVTQ